MLTLDEEVNLPHALEGLKGRVDDVVIVDSFSKDRTREIAEVWGARFVEHRFEGHARQWLWGFQSAGLKHDWVFMHDPDHRVTPELWDEMERLFKAGIPEDVDGLYVRRRNVFRGKWIRHGGYYPKWMLKIVRNRGVAFDEHEFDYRVYVPGRTLQLQGDIWEENFKEEAISFWLQKHIGFANKQAEEEMFRAEHPERWKVVPRFFGTPDQRTLWLKIRWYHLPLYVRPFLYFFYRFFVKLGFLDGKQGILFHFLQAFWYRLVVDVRLEELRRPGSGHGEAQGGTR